MSRSIGLVAMMLLPTAFALHGEIYYVSPTGDDDYPGTISHPWETIQKAMNSATAGSTVNILAGTYPERLTVNVSGTADNPIVFQNYGYTVSGSKAGEYEIGGDSVFLDYSTFGTITDGVPALEINGQSYIRIQGLRFRNYQCTGAMQRGIWIHGTAAQVELKHNTFTHFRNIGPWDGTCALLNFWTDSPAHHVWIYGNEFGWIQSNYGEAVTPSAQDVTIENNWIHDVDGIAVDAQIGSAGCIIRGNLLEWISRKRDGSTWYNNPSNAIYTDGGNQIIIERNTIRDSEYAIALLSEPGRPAAHDIIVRNNVAMRCRQAAFMAGTWYSDTDSTVVYNCKFLNNTAYECAAGFLIRPFSSGSMVWKNNIIASCEFPVMNTLLWPVGGMDYNLYYGGGAPGPDPHKITADPEFSDVSLEDFSLQSTSPAINSGDPDAATSNVGLFDFAGNSRILGGRIDMGASEYEAGPGMRFQAQGNTGGNSFRHYGFNFLRTNECAIPVVYDLFGKKTGNSEMKKNGIYFVRSPGSAAFQKLCKAK